MQLRIVEFFFLHKKVPVVLYRYLFVKKKVFNYSELHFFKMTFYNIDTLSFTILNCFVLKSLCSKTKELRSVQVKLLGLNKCFNALGFCKYFNSYGKITSI